MNQELPTSKNHHDQLIELLQENNHYLKQLLDLKRKEHREAVIGHIFHTILTMLPWIAVLVLGYFVWQTLMQYLDALNSNINTLKGNFEALSDFIQKITPDFGSVMPKLKDTWENIQFWKP